MVDALFTRAGEVFAPTRLTEGPWSPDAQHGGPPAALLSGAIENVASDVEMLLVRVSVELLRPVPLAPLRVTTELVRPGRRVQLVSASLSHDGEPVARALGMKIRVADFDLPFPQPDTEEIPGPGQGRPANFFDNAGAFANEAMDIQMIEGDFNEAGPGQAWMRLRVPVVEGEETTGFQRLAAAADFGNGVSNLAGDNRSWLFVNPDLAVRVFRPLVGEWVYLDCVTHLHGSGTGLASAQLRDTSGPLGVSQQTLFVEPFRAG
ncbi:MAG TPA: thioesterase family protein [Acidimicrobiia bacterium]